MNAVRTMQKEERRSSEGGGGAGGAKKRRLRKGICYLCDIARRWLMLGLLLLKAKDFIGATNM